VQRLTRVRKLRDGIADECIVASGHTDVSAWRVIAPLDDGPGLSAHRAMRCHLAREGRGQKVQGALGESKWTDDGVVGVHPRELSLFLVVPQVLDRASTARLADQRLRAVAIPMLLWQMKVLIPVKELKGAPV
jgi:hypothetical protein